jgi:outer membrane protein
MQRIAKQLQVDAGRPREECGPTMGESDRRNKEREFNDLNRDFQRKQREFREDLNQRRNEELAAVLERANKLGQADRRSRRSTTSSSRKRCTPNPRIDITDKVIKALG